MECIDQVLLLLIIRKTRLLSVESGTLNATFFFYHVEAHVQNLGYNYV